MFKKFEMVDKYVKGNKVRFGILKLKEKTKKKTMIFAMELDFEEIHNCLIPNRAKLNIDLS